MQLTVTGKQVEIGDALRRHAQSRLEAILEKYFKTAIEAHVVAAREAHLVQTEISVHIGRGIVCNAGAASDDVHVAFDAAAERVAKQLRRHKRRLRDHHAKAREPADLDERARDAALAPVVEEGDTGSEDSSGGGPTVVAEISGELPNLTVGEAVMRMDLADAPVLLFRNRAHGELNVLYRRPDGHIGWIDPNLDPARHARRRRG
jgi:ribosomal subunit interface protein